MLDMEQFSFSQLQQLLQQQKLVEVITPETEPPVEITYIMESDAASELGLDPADKPDEAANYSLLQLDLDVIIPALAPYRCRELLRRVKRRELEYTSSRPKARYLLPSLAASATTSNREDDERWVRQQMDRAAPQEDTDDTQLIPLQLALAKAAPAGSEARTSLYLDAATAHVLRELRTQLRRHATPEAAGPSLEACHAWLNANSGQPGADDDEWNSEQERSR